MEKLKLETTIAGFSLLFYDGVSNKGDLDNMELQQGVNEVHFAKLQLDFSPASKPAHAHTLLSAHAPY